MSTPNCDLSFDPADPYFPMPAGFGLDGVAWAIQVFTTINGYGIDPATVELHDTGDRQRLVATGYARLGQQAKAGTGRIEVDVTRGDGPCTFAIRVEHPEPIKSVKLILRGLPDHDLTQGWWSPTSPVGTTTTGRFQWNYPGPEWATRWASAGGTTVSLRGAEVTATVLHVGTPAYSGRPEVELVHSAPAGARTNTLVVPPIRLAVGGDTERQRADLEAHLTHVSESFGHQEWDVRSDLPAWARDTSLVITLHGQHWTGHVFHTFDEMATLLQQVAEVVNPRTVLVYLPGWDGRYYYDYPRYEPGPDLGGEEAFARLIHGAQQAGFRIMPMLGANGVNIESYPEWEQAAIMNDTNRYPIMLNAPDWDSDRSPETDQVFLNPGEPGFRERLIDAVGRLVDRYGVDAVFFDTAGFWFDDPRYPIYDGYRALVTELRDRHPQLLLVSEGWWDAMTALFPMSQQWLGVERDIRFPDLLTRFSRTTSHLAEGTPGLGSTGVHEQGYRLRPRDRPIAGHLPVISFAGGTGEEQLRLLAQLAPILLSTVPSAAGARE